MQLEEWTFIRDRYIRPQLIRMTEKYLENQNTSSKIEKRGRWRRGDVQNNTAPDYVLAVLALDSKKKDTYIKAIVSHLDYLYRAQSLEGAFTHNWRDGWYGLPNRRLYGYNCVMGFAMYPMARAFTILADQDKFREYLREPAWKESTPRRKLYREMIGMAMSYMTSPKWPNTGRPAAPNQAAINAAALIELNHAYALTGDQPLYSPTQLKDHIESFIFQDRWWSKLGMPLEMGGYDPNYTMHTIHFLTVLHHRIWELYQDEPVLIKTMVKLEQLITKIWSVLKYFFRPRTSWPGDYGYSYEYKVARRIPTNKRKEHLPCIAISQGFHPCARILYRSMIPYHKNYTPWDWGIFTSQWVDWYWWYECPRVEKEDFLKIEAYFPTRQKKDWVFHDPEIEIRVTMKDRVLTYEDLRG